MSVGEMFKQRGWKDPGAFGQARQQWILSVRMSASKAGGQQAGVPANKKTGRGSVMANRLTMRTTEEVSVLANELAMLLWVEGRGGGRWHSTKINGPDSWLDAGPWPAGMREEIDEGLNSLFSMLVQARWLRPIVRCKFTSSQCICCDLGIAMAQGVSTTIPCQSQSSRNTTDTHWW